MEQTMTPINPIDQDDARRFHNFRSAAAVICVLGLAATVVFHAAPPGVDAAAPGGLSSMPSAAADELFLHTLARDPSVPRAQDVFAGREPAPDEPQAPTF
ncbi:MAG: hypothetical protein ABIX11_09360 [Casimicrobiaceae bacterium]